MKRNPWSEPYRTRSPTTAQTEIHDVLTDPARRAVVAELLDDRHLTVDELAARLADHPETPDSRQTEAWVIHDHVLPMADAGIVTYDADARTVSLAPGVTFSLPTPPDENRSPIG